MQRHQRGLVRPVLHQPGGAAARPAVAGPVGAIVGAPLGLAAGAAAGTLGAAGAVAGGLVGAPGYGTMAGSYNCPAGYQPYNPPNTASPMTTGVGYCILATAAPMGQGQMAPMGRGPMMGGMRRGS